MIIARSPLRITLGGGGTDLPSYYQQREGFLLSAAIDKYVYILVNRTFDSSIQLKYSKLERVRDARDLQHPIVKEALSMLDLFGEPLEICSMADIPAGTGLGSSSTFTTALLCALHCYKRDIVGTRRLAEEACELEINRLGEPIGKQDQYISAYGGINSMTFHPDGSVDVVPMRLSPECLYNLEDHLILFFTGFTHSAGNLLEEQDKRSRANDSDMLENLDFVKQLGVESKEALEVGDFKRFAEILNVHWEHKRRRSGGMSNPDIDYQYEYALRNGAMGGKLVGAGGGGFFLFCTEEKARLRRAMQVIGLEEVRFRFEQGGAKIV